MSLILDALRRAERARERDIGRRVSESAPPVAPRRRAGSRWGVLIPAAGVPLLLLAVVLWLRQTAVEMTPEAQVPVAEEIAEPTPITPARGSSLAEITLPERSPPTPPVRSDAPLLGDLPSGVRITVPPVEMNAHYWTADAARRFVVLDMARYREGDALRNGLRVVAILPEGVELDWRGTRFRLLAH